MYARRPRWANERAERLVGNVDEIMNDIINERIQIRDYLTLVGA
jgi:hypothetical protein